MEPGSILLIDTVKFLCVSSGITHVIVQQLHDNLTPTSGASFRLPIEGSGIRTSPQYHGWKLIKD